MNLERYVSLFGSTHKTRFAYVRLPVLREALEDDRVLTALLDVLEVPGKPAVLRSMSREQKLEAIERQIEHYRATSTSLWRDVPLPYVLAASIQRSDLPDKIVYKIFSDVKKESALCKPVTDWYSGEGFVVHEEVPLGACRADLVSIKEGRWLSNKEIIAIELKNDLAEMRRALDQMTTYREYAHKVYFACTPWLAADYLLQHSEGHKVKHYDHELLDRRLKELGFGLLLVEGNEIYEHLEPSTREPNKRKLEELTLALESPKKGRARR
jgi:hypothetical protein